MSAPFDTAFARSSAAPRRTPAVVRLLVVATFVVILNETIMINAIPRLMESFGVSEHAAQWVSTAFMLTMAAVIPVTGWFLRRVSTRTAYATSMGVFIAGTTLAAVAPVFEVLLLGRVVQAAGTAVMMPLLMTTLMTVVAPRERCKVMGNVTLAMAVAPALGPAVSGVLLQLGSWRWIFAVVVPIALGMLAIGLRKLVNVGEPQPGAIDWSSVVLAALGFGTFVYGLSQIGVDPGVAGGLPAIPTLVLGAVLVAVFGWRQLRLQRTGTPLLDLRTLGYRVFAVSLALMCLSFMALMGVMITLPLFLQGVSGMTPLATGLLLMPGGLVMGLLGPRVGALFDRYGARVLVVPGSALLLAVLAGFTTIGTSSPAWWLLTLHVLMSVAFALIFTPVFTTGLGALPPHLYPHGSAVLGTLQQVAAAIGTAVVVTVLSVRSATLAASGSDPVSALSGGIQMGMVFAAVIGVAVLVLAFFVPGRESAGQGHGPSSEDEHTAPNREDAPRDADRQVVA
jgi:MFS transporter, DHA2 family, lincomycin resistance protein